MQCSSGYMRPVNVRNSAPGSTAFIKCWSRDVPALFVSPKLEQRISDLEASELGREDDYDCLVQFLPATLLLKLCCFLPLRERMLSLFGGRALHQQVSSKYSQLFGRSPQNVAADRPGGALSRVPSPYNRCALGTCERSDAPAATERRIQPATRNLKARASRLACVQGSATILNDDDFPCYH